MNNTHLPDFPSLYDNDTNDVDIWTKLFFCQSYYKNQPPQVLAKIRYEPLQFFSPPPGASVAWSELDEICELAIRLKEIELLKLVGGGFDSRRYIFLKTLKDEKMQQLQKDREKTNP
ncbi:hypothetical protein EOD39_0514 [Acipenser ruthenus]|uniref:Uncharacterized protein n=1 Tax=Acipenser ruthenus TaxID=7906 RepID=A0A444U0W6_ACIRT|nr:hypothetical protein EOD39_0514 [Acipenser ruthenus]